jgi:WD40 repeat protein
LEDDKLTKKSNTNNQMPVPMHQKKNALSLFDSQKKLQRPYIRLGHRIKATKRSPLVAMLISPFGDIIFGGYSGVNSVITPSGKYYRLTPSHLGWVSCLACNINGLLASGGHDNLLRTYNLHNNGEPMHEVPHDDVVHAVSFSPDSPQVIATGGRTGSIKNILIKR